jgi:hypothetical protein
MKDQIGEKEKDDNQREKKFFTEETQDRFHI